MPSATVKMTKEGNAKYATSGMRKPRAHPPYSEMINEAITALKERTGSSQFAIAKFIEEKQKANLPNNYKKLLLVQLKKLVAKGKLVKVKNSFKLPPKFASTSDAAKKPKSSSSSTACKKPKSSSASDGDKKLKTTKKPKSSSTSAAEKKPKPSSTGDAAKKPKLKPKAKEIAVQPAKSPAKKAVVAAKAKKPKSIKSPVKKVVAKRGKK